MTPVWLHRSQPGFGDVEAYVSTSIWGEPREIPGDTALLSVAPSGDLVGAAIFQNYNADAGTIEISAAASSPRWLSRRVLREMFSYPFDQLGCQAVVLRCDPASRRLDRILTAYGFNRHDIPRLRGRDCPEAIYVLADDAWRSNGFHRRSQHG